MADIRADKDPARESRDDSDLKKGLVDTSFAAGFETKAFEALERDFQEVRLLQHLFLDIATRVQQHQLRLTIQEPS